MTSAGALAAAGPPASVVSAGRLGLYPARNFRLTDGACADCGPIPSARWYFERETIAVPNPGLPTAAFARGVDAFDDLRAWRVTRAADAPPDYPPLVWVAAPQVIMVRGLWRMPARSASAKHACRSSSCRRFH
jgi:hypothetical protein